MLICSQSVFGKFSYPVFLEESDWFTVMDNKQVICLGVYSQADELTIRHKLLQATADSSFSFISIPKTAAKIHTKSSKSKRFTLGVLDTPRFSVT